MQKIYVLLGLFALSFRAFSQDTIPTPIRYLEPVVSRVTFIGLGFQKEVSISRRSTLNLGLHVAFNGNIQPASPYFNPSGKDMVTSLSLAPDVGLALRHFYNFEQRLARQKSIRYNSGNYLAARVRYIPKPIWEKVDFQAPLTPINGFYGEGLWGFQRTYRRNFYLNLSLGVGLGPNGVYPAGDFQLGYTFPN